MNTVVEYVRRHIPLLIALASFLFAGGLAFVGWFPEFRLDDGLLVPPVLDSGAWVVAIMAGLLALHGQLASGLAPPAGVVSETRRTWRMMALAMLVGFGPAAGYAAGILYDATARTGDALAETCAVQEHIVSDEGELSTAVAERRLYGTVSNDACATAGATSGPGWVIRGVRGLYHLEHENLVFSGQPVGPYVWGERALSVPGWALEPSHAREHAALLAAQSWSPGSGVTSVLMSPLQIGFAHALLAVGVVWLVGCFPAFRRVPLAPRSATSRLIRAVAIGALCVLCLFEYSSRQVEDVIVWWAGIPLAISLALIAGSRFRRILHLAWPAAVLLIVATIFSATLHGPRYVYRKEADIPLLFVSVALLAATIVLTPLYAAINERIRVLPE